MIKALKKLQTIYYCILNINWISFFKLYNSNSNTILWYYPGFRRKFFLQSVERDFAFIGAFITLNMPFKIYFGKKIGKFKNKIIFYSVTKDYEPFGFNDYTNILYHISKRLEEQGNTVYPTSHETLFWENKVYMHKMFEDLRIKSPKTIILNSISDLKNISITFPCLIKEPHSSSSMGLYKVNSFEEITQLIQTGSLFKRNESLILQELLDIKKDLRIITVGSKICSHYWRINLGGEWRPTATGYGSRVDFEYLPSEWVEWIENVAKKLQLTTAGFDITWQGDDLSSEPYVLEVSPFYQPNPPASMENKNYTYGQFKKKLLIRNSWDKSFVDIVFRLQESTVTHFLQKYNKNGHLVESDN